MTLRSLLWTLSPCLLLLMASNGPLSAQRIVLSQDRFEVTRDADTPLAAFSVVGAPALEASRNNMPFREDLPFRAVESITTLPANGPRFLIVTPAQGTTPANVAVGLNPEVVPFLAPGAYSAGFTYRLDLPGEATGTGGFVALRIRPLPPPVITAVLNSATRKSVIAPGASVSIAGSDLGSPARAVKADIFAVYPVTAGNTTVTFNGIRAPLTFVDRTRIDAVVPLELAGQTSARVIVEHFSRSSVEFVVPLQATAPGIFATSDDGSGQGDILQTTRANSGLTSPNSAANPVERGAAVVIFATGAGVWNQDVRAGQILLGPQAPPIIAPRAPVSLTIGGKRAFLLYAGAAPTKVGVIQVNALVPDDVESGEQVVELTVGQHSNTAQQRVTLAVQ